MIIIKVAFVVQRYGLEVNGGAELLCRLIAEKLSADIDIEVLTTCAKDYITWKNDYQSGLQEVNNIKVRRFPVSKERDINEFNRYSDYIFQSSNVSHEEQLEWINQQGPYCPDMLTFVEEHKEDYDYFAFFTYLYYPTVLGLPLVADKSIFIPTAHDEGPIRLDIFKPLFQNAKAIVYNSLEEKEFVNDFFNNADVKNDVIGIGVDLPKSKISAKDFKQKYLVDDFIIYMGRLEEAKGLSQLFDYFLNYLEVTKANVKLLLFGKGPMTVPRHPNIINFGFVSEQDKFNAMAASKVVVVPSELESLSIVSLEAWLAKSPILANGKSLVVKGSCERSNGGFCYTNFEEFKEKLDILLTDRNLAKEMGNQGYQYVQENYNWNIVKNKYLALF